MLFVLTGPNGAQEKPWSERAIIAHVDQNDLRGELPAMVLEELRHRGEVLFTAKFTAADGAGRPLATQASIPTKRDAERSRFDRAGGPDANSCAGCHNQPAIGGAGDFATNIFIAESSSGESAPMPNPALANERGTTHIFGAGLIELLAREMTVDLHQIRDSAVSNAQETGNPVSFPLETKGVNFGTIAANADGTIDTSGIEGIDPDLTIKPFGQKGVFVSLREFTVHVLNHHHGMQADERFGFAQTGELDFDGDGVSDEISSGDVSALVAWQAGLKPPSPSTPENESWKSAAKAGSNHFDEFGCSNCHIRALPLESLMFSDPGPLDAQGTLSQADVTEPAIYNLALMEWASSLPRDESGNVLVPLFGDLKRYRIAEDGGALGNEQLPQRGVGTQIFMTAELWGLSATAPYGHRNDFTTIDEIIRAHGGEAQKSRQAYINAASQDRDALIAFLKTFGLEGK